ncbi:hypothetical protein DF185_19810 [Marinifilum breve]|uniref:Uncharacterized protein n=1 Tax=Marinifilum breve TaxID=2184082 RepID=A0A2V3ZSQ5_9BACT|nr:hypothetical protein [Marinifilum breve]PXX96888.1 hypothetical protein DF185_19810 [Marinifilum breve]
MKKTVFNIQIHLSEQQLKKLCEIDGFGPEEIESYYRMAKMNPGFAYDDNPSYQNGLGAMINDILSIGFSVMNAMEGYGEMKVKKEDLHFHPFRYKYPVFTKVECELKDFVNTSPYEPMEFALAEKPKE